ncbi:dephospho-CoA kinase [Paracoccaceae bacterium]|nr:dephospho-CoA kinase [Paracoccaceae bacterium]
MNKKSSFILGLTGSIAMGKTTVSNMFRDIGVPVWCADNEVNNLYSKNGAATQIFVKEFPSVVTDIGVDKTKLRNLIHRDNTTLRKIEEIVHPLLRGSRTSFADLYKKQPIIIYDIPLLFEKNQDRNFDAVVLVTASEVTQKSRVLKRKNITEKDFQLIKRNQLNEKDKLKRANFILNTDKPLLETKEDVKDLYRIIMEMAG